MVWFVIYSSAQFDREHAKDKANHNKLLNFNDWENHTNTKMHISFQYPRDSQLTEYPDQGDIFVNPPYDVVSIEIASFPAPDRQGPTFKDYITKKYSISQPLVNFKVDNNESYSTDFFGTNYGGFTSEEKDVYIKTENLAYSVKITGIFPLYADYYKQVFQHFLANIKFI